MQNFAIQKEEIDDEELEKYGPTIEPAPIDFQLDMENLSFFAAEGEHSIPFARVTLNDLRIQFFKSATNDIYTNLYGLELDGSCFKREREDEFDENSKIVYRE